MGLRAKLARFLLFFPLLGLPLAAQPAIPLAPCRAAEPAPDTKSSAPESSVRDIPVPGGFLGLPLNPKGPLETRPSGSSALRGSRWVDYDTHELLEMIGELEDERRWSRLREGFWLALLFHILLFSAITWIPTYIFKVPKVVDPFDEINKRKDLTYLDVPPDALHETRPKVAPKPLPNRPLIDKKTLDELNQQAPPTPPPPLQQAPDQPAPDTDAAELRGEGDVDDDDLVVGAVDDEPSGALAVHANDRVGGVWEGFPVMAGLGGELHTDEGVLLLFGPAEPGQFRPASGRVEGQEKVAVVWATLGTDADFAVHEAGILAEELQGMAAAERALIDRFLLLGFGATSADLKAEYDVSWLGTEMIDGQQTSHIQLLPKSKDVLQRLKKAELWIAEANGLPAQQRFVTSAGGDFTLVVYTAVKLNPAISDNSLKLNLPKGVQIQHPQL